MFEELIEATTYEELCEMLCKELKNRKYENVTIGNTNGDEKPWSATLEYYPENA